jgi:hypothetical protein
VIGADGSLAPALHCFVTSPWCSGDVGEAQRNAESLADLQYNDLGQGSSYKVESVSCSMMGLCRSVYIGQAEQPLDMPGACASIAPASDAGSSTPDGAGAGLAPLRRIVARADRDFVILGPCKHRAFAPLQKKDPPQRLPCWECAELTEHNPPLVKTTVLETGKTQIA